MFVQRGVYRKYFRYTAKTEGYSYLRSNADILELYEIVLERKETGGRRMLQVSHYIDVKKRAQELGCNIPTSIALLPRNFEISASKEELIHESTTPTVRVLWRKTA